MDRVQEARIKIETVAKQAQNKKNKK